MDDAAVVGDIVFKSDSHAVKPIFFPGGDIGRLSISGTVNDISAMGARLTLGLRLYFRGGLAHFGFGADFGEHAGNLH